VSDRRSEERHRRITEQSFARQAEEFSRSPLMTDPALLARLVEWCEVSGQEAVLDVACGPGLVAAALAPRAGVVVGIDVTAAMLSRAAEVAGERRASNARFVRGDVTHLPFPDARFDRVVSRRAFHHFPEPAAVLAEMARVCDPRGALIIEDQALPADPAAAEIMTTVDRLRDPSHTRAISPDAWPALFAASGLQLERMLIIPRELEVDEWLPRAHPTPENAARVREMLAAAARGEVPGLPARNVAGRLRFTLGLQLVRARPAPRASR
jgi:ubiquinone/menaquinone biosynthesis C-methylase UbiE